MATLYLVFVGLLSVVAAELPCRLYDVTTMVRLGKKANAPKGASGISNYEVHSRTNAVGVPMEFNHPKWLTSFKDPLQNSNVSCVFNTTDVCPGWTTADFTPTCWFEDDSLFNWEEASNRVDNDRVYVWVDPTHMAESRWLVIRAVRPDEAIKLRFRHGPGLKFYFGLLKDDVEEVVKSGSGDGPSDSDDDYGDDDDDAGEVRASNSKSSHGFEFSYLSNSSMMFEEKRFTKNGSNPFYLEGIAERQGIVQLPQPHAVVTLFVARNNDDGNLCLWSENTLNALTLHRICYPVRSRRPYEFGHGIMLIMKPKYDLSTLSLYRANLGSKAIKLNGDPASVITPELALGRKGGFCVSFRYYSNKGATTKIQFLPVVNGTIREALRKAYLQGAGKPVSTQFEIVIPKSLRKQKWRLKFEFSSNGSFILQSLRQCSGKGRDDITVPLVMPDYRNASHGRILIRNDDENLVSMDRAVNELVPKLGVGLSCPHKEISINEGVTKCYNGGVNIDGWCQCFPGFTGPLCKKACPPERFGADCSGSCNHLGKHDCVGIKMAAPGSKLQCARGYYGPQCDQSKSANLLQLTCGCRDGFYGQDCQLKCGHCSRSSCNRYTGLCDDPCKSGYGGPSCDTEIASVYRPVITATGYNFVEGYVNITLSDETLSLYPFFEIRYVLLRYPFKKSKKLLKLTSNTPVFRIDHMKHGQQYRMHAVLVHQSGEVSRGEVKTEDAAIIETDCNANTTFTDVDVGAGSGALSLRWNVTEDDPYLCQKIKYKIEIDSDNLEDPIIEEAEPDDNHKTIAALLPNEGTVRIKALYVTKEGEWSDHYPFSSIIVTEKPSVLKVLNKTSRTIEFLWSKSDSALEDMMTCEAESMLCRGISRGSVERNVREGTFILENLEPFSVYTCTLKSFVTTISTITEEEIPSGAPKHHSTPLKSVKNTTATIQWLGPECFDINGLRQGFKVMLYSGGKLISTSEVSDDDAFSVVDEHFCDFENLQPDTEYEAKVFLLNHVGVNPKYSLNITFKTKSRHPEAVRNLIVYKRTKHDLWLRWSEPEEFTFIAGSFAKIADDFKVIASSPGLESKSEEIAMTKCRTWPDYFCHRIRSLFPNKEYTISVLSRDSIHKMYGPSSEVNASTIEGVPDPPKNLQLVNRTTKSITVSWEVPLMLNSNPRFFVASVEQSAESGSEEFDLPVIKIPISDGIHLYQAKFDHLAPMSTYTVTVGASMQGARSSVTVHTPPLDPLTPLSPDLLSPEPRISVLGLPESARKQISGYLLLVARDSGVISDGPGIFDKDLQSLIEEKFTGNFYVAKEYPPSLEAHTFVLTPSESFNGSFSLIQRKPLSSRDWIALAVFSNYKGLYTVSVSDSTIFY